MEDEPKLYRVILQVSDVEQGSSFYTRLLGIEGMRISPGRHYFHCGGVILGLLDPGRDGDEFQARPNPDHVYFSVVDLEAIDSRARELGCLSQEDGARGERR